MPREFLPTWARRVLLCGALCAGLAGCGTTPAPAIQWVRLPAEPAAAGSAVAASAAGSARGAAWQLMLPLQLPGHLDRDALLVAQGAAGLQPFNGARWAEPLREAVPRLLQQDLSHLLGPARIWTAPLPQGLRPPGQLRVELSQFDVGPDARNGQQVVLAARWVLATPGSEREPTVRLSRFTVPAGSSEPQALAMAHRQALWLLAQELAQAMR